MRAISTAIVIVVLAAGPGPVIAQTRPDPMRAAAAQAGTPSPDDPMAALRAPAEEAEGQPTANADLGGLPDGPGAEDTFYQCTACHSTEIIKQQRLADARWDYLWNWMIEEQGMYDPDPETKDAILGYLKSHFSSEG